MKIAIGNDHAAVELKWHIKEYLEKKGYEVINCGTDDPTASDYPISGARVGKKVASGECDFGIAICGTGVGISLAVNKIKGIRCACVSEPVSARLTREHNNANVIAFGARIVGSVMAEAIVDTFLTTPFSGSERHVRRINMITAIENGEEIE